MSLSRRHPRFGRLAGLVWGLVILSLILPLQAPEPAHAQDEVSYLLSMINNLRAQVGSGQYYANSALMASAQAHSQWMADTGIVSHDQTNGSTPGSRAAGAGYGGSLVSENIYAGTLGIASADTAFQWWVGSPVHYAGMTDVRKNEIGIGIATNDSMIYYTLVFGKGGSGGSAPNPPAPPAANIGSAGGFGEAPAQTGGGEQQQIPPTPQPTRPLITFTPSPTIPTSTFTPTWTPTHTWTPTSTLTLAPPTGTAVLLPTTNLTQLAAWVGTQQAASGSVVPTLTPTSPFTEIAMQADAPTIVSVVATLAPGSGMGVEPPRDVNQPVQRGVDWRILLVMALGVQLLALGGAVWWFFARNPGV